MTACEEEVPLLVLSPPLCTDREVLLPLVPVLLQDNRSLLCSRHKR